MNNDNHDIEAILNNIDLILNGNYKAHIDVDSEEKFGELATKINELAEHLQSLFSALKKIAKGNFSYVKDTKSIPTSLKKIQTKKILPLCELSEACNKMAIAFENEKAKRSIEEDKIKNFIDNMLLGKYKDYINVDYQSGYKSIEEKLNDLCNHIEYCFISILRIARGQLSSEIEGTSGLPAGIKTIQADLRHLAWQAERIAAGELDRRIFPRGELSGSFNHMASCLMNARNELKSLNQKLEKEVQKRLEEKEFIKTTLKKYVSEDVVEDLLKSPDKISLGGVLKEVTILFSDIRSFSTISEKMSPKEIVFLLNEYFSAMVEIIYKYDGTLDKYIGDSIMAVYGGTHTYKNSAERAVRSALEMLERLNQLNEDFSKKDIPALNIGIGINTGNVILGNIGAQNRMEYTVIGDNVNVASRIGQRTKDYYDSKIIISGNTYERVKEIVEVMHLGRIRVKGKEQPVDIFDLSGISSDSNLSGT